MQSPHSVRVHTQPPGSSDHGSHRRRARRSRLTCLAVLAIVATLLPLAPAAHAAGNQAVQLDGADGHGILLGSPGSLGSAQFTLELWFKRTGTGTTVSTGSGGVTTAIPLITKGRSESDGSTIDTNYFLGINTATNALAADFEDMAAGANHPVLGSTVITQNVWHHAAATFNGSQFCLYLDGALDGTCTATTAVPRSDSIQTPAVGTSTNSTGLAAGGFLGQVDEARIWNAARSLAQISGSMNQELTSGTGLVGRWGMNDGSGSTATASVGPNGSLTTGATWVAGAPALGTPPPSGNTGIQFDGTNDYVTFGAAPGLTAPTFTIETWFNRTGTGAGTTTGTGGIASAIPLVTKGRGEAEASNVDMNYFLGIDGSTGRLVADYEEGAAQTSPGLNHPVSGTTVVTQNAWHHAAATFDGTTLSVYLDGVLDGTLNVGANRGPRSDSIQHAGLGTAMTSTGVAAGFFAGVLDEARIWNVAHSQAQIQATINQELTSGTGLIGRWGLNDASGPTATGSVGPTGTLTNGPTWVAGAPALTAPPPPTGNTGVQLDGADGHGILLGSPGSLGAAQFTLELWFNRTGTGGTVVSTGSGGVINAIPLITKGRSENDGSNIDTNYFLGINKDTGTLAADFEDMASGLNHPVLGTTNVSLNTWHHAAATFNGSQFCLYLDGALDGTCTATTAVPRSDSIQTPAIGTSTNSTGLAAGGFLGQVDEVRIWNTARSIAQISGSMNQELTSGAGLIGRYGLNQGSGTTATASVGPNGSLTAGATWVAGAPALSAPGASPDAPVVVGPLNGATGVTMPPTLDVIASDADSTGLTVTFYGREHATPPGPDFTIVAIPDTQWYSEQVALWPQFTAQTNWIVNTKGTLNTVFATHLGDVAQNYDTIPAEYQRASQSMAILDNNGVKNNLSPGNHDFASGGSSSTGSLYDQFFPPSRYQGFPWYGGYLGDPNDGIADGGFNRLNKDNYELFTASGMDFLIIHIENDMPSYAVAWAQNVINAFPNRKVIISTHAFVTNTGVRGTAPVSRADGQSAQAVWNSLIAPNCQIFMVLNGHYHGQGRRTDPNSCGQPVFQLNSDYQDYVNGGDGYLRYYTFKPSENKINAFTYSPTTTGDPDGFDSSSAGQFSLDWPMSAAGAYTEIGSVSGVASGAHATIQWNGLDQSTQYDWYAVVSDGSHTTTGSTQSFTTEVPAPAAPVIDSVSIDQANPHTNDTLSVTVQSHDANQDPVTYTYQWIKNGSPISGATNATLNLGTTGNGDKGDQITVQVTGHDGTFDSTPVTSPAATVENATPSATVGLAPATPRPTQLVTATATRTDLDQSDAVTLSYVWKLNGTIVKTTSASSNLTDTIDLAQVNAATNDTLRVEVTPNDGTVDGTMVSASVPVYAPTVAALPNSTYQVNGRVNTMIRVGNRVYIGGDFTQLLGHSGEVVPRLNLAALDAETGVPVAWDPSADGVVFTLAASPDGSTIYAGGAFKHLGALTRTRLAAINATSGAVLPWAPSASLTVRSMVASASTVYVGGQFQNLSGVARAGLGAINASTGAILAGWTPSANGIPMQMLMTPDGRVMVVGAFTTINGSPSQYLAALDATNGALLPWASQPPAPSEGFTMGSGRLFVGVDANASNNQVFAYNLNTGQQQWVATGDGDAIALTFLDGVVYAGGHFDLINGQVRHKLAGFDPVTGALRDWATSVNTAVAVLSMTSGNHKLYIGGGFTQVNGVDQARYAVFAGPPSASIPPVVDSVSIDQASPGTGDTLSATVTAHDADGDPITYAYQWTRNGVDIGGANQATLDLSLANNGDKGDQIRVRVTASDGAGTSPAVTSSAVTIVNAAPAASVALDSDAPGSNATLTATVTRSDADGDTVTLTYLWTVNGATKRTTVTTGLTDSFDLSVAGNGDPGDVIVVTVTPNDGTANGSAATDSATVGTGAVPPIFSDDFGTLGSWTTVTRLTLDSGLGSPSAPSARAQVAGLSAFATRDLGSAYNQVCFSTNVNLASGSTFDVLRMLTGSGGKIIKVALNATNRLLVRSEFATTVMNSQIVLGTGWHNIELCGTVGTSTTWDLYRDGVRIVNAWQANTGTTGVGRIQIGDAAATTFTANFDHVVLDVAPGDSAVSDTTPPTTPGTPTGSSLSAGSITINWVASTDDTPPITYRVYRDGGPISIGSTLNTSFTDSGLTPGSSHSYTVDAVDGVNLASAMSAPSAMIPVIVGTPSIFSDDFNSGDFSAWTSTTQLLIDNAIGSPSAPSARVQTAGAAAFAARDLGSTFSQVCLSVNVNVSSGSGFDLLRLRTAANGPIIKLAVNAGGKVQIRSEVGATSLNSGVALGAGWHNVEVCGTVGAATAWDVYRDGVKIVNAWAANTGTTPVGRIQIGDAAAATFTANFDHIVLDQVVG